MGDKRGRVQPAVPRKTPKRTGAALDLRRAVVRLRRKRLLRRAAAAPFEVWYFFGRFGSQKVHLLASARRVPRAVQLRVLQAQAERRGRVWHRVSYYNLPHARDGGVARGAPRVWRDLFGEKPRHGDAAGVQVILVF